MAYSIAEVTNCHHSLYSTNYIKAAQDWTSMHVVRQSIAFKAYIGCSILDGIGKF